MSWFGVLKLFLRLADSISQYMSRKQLLDAGQAIAIRNNLYDTLKKVERIEAARRNVVVDIDSLRDDPNNRD